VFLSRFIAWCIGLLAAIMSLMLLAAVYEYGHNVPFFDDWNMIPFVAGQERITQEWLWSQYNEHRMPLTKLLFVGLYRISGGDLRAAMYFNAAALIAMALLMLQAAFTIRGRLAITDAFIPLLLLSWGHQENLLWASTVGYLLFTLLAVLAVHVMAARAIPSRAAALIMAAAVCAFPLTGAIGLLYAGPLSTWMILAAIAIARREPSAARDLGAGGLLGFCLIGLYFVGYHRSAVPPSSGIVGLFRSGVDFLGTSICPLPPLASLNIGGMSVRELWGSAAAVILLVGGIINVVAALRVRGEFVRRSGMAFAIAGTLVLALAIGWGRRQGQWSRYAILSAPGLLAVYISTIFPQAAFLGWLLRGILFVAALVAAWPNFTAGGERIDFHHDKMLKFERDLRAGVPPMVLADHYSRPPTALHRRQREKDVAADIGLLKRSGVRQFRDVRDDPIYRVVDIGPGPRAEAGRMIYDVPEAWHVYAVRLNYQYQPQSPDDSRAQFFLSWVPKHFSAKHPTGSYACELPKDGREDHLLVWIDEPIGELSISPDTGSFDGRITNVQLLVR
jgi:hypothetical protein